MNWTGKVPFEVHEMRAKPDGFELTFTHPATAASLSDLASYKMEAYTYICLLYTSDAADEEDSVDLGGRRIIKKKTKKKKKKNHLDVTQSHT